MSGDLFVSVQIQFVDITKPTFVAAEMAPVHANSNASHSSVAKDFYSIGYYAHATERASSAFCGDMTDQIRWILFGHASTSSSFDMLAYCNNTYAFGAGALDDINNVPGNLWKTEQLVFRKRDADDYSLRR